jgi:HSP20 family protein
MKRVNLETLFGNPLEDWIFGSDFKNFNPPVNAFRENDKINIDVFFPGAKKSDFDISVEEDLLTIKGKCGYGEKKEDVSYYLKEQGEKSFERTFRIKDYIKRDEVFASYKDGVLKITIPIDKKAEQEKKYKIQIK